jgi:hypothetical protein
MQNGNLSEFSGNSARERVSATPQPRFGLFQSVRVHVGLEAESESEFEAEGIICGLLIEDLKRYPSREFLLPGWWYEVLFHELPTCPYLIPPIREWVHESEICPIPSSEGGSPN